MSIEQTGNDVVNEVIEGLDKVSLIPQNNQMVDTFFYDYAYPRLMGIEEDEVFISNYARQFGLNKPVQLFDEAGNKTGVVPAFLNSGVINSDINLHKQAFEYKMANERSPGLGDKIVSPALENIKLEIEAVSDADSWNPIHQEYLKRHAEVTPQTNEDISPSLDELMEWD